MVRRTALVVYVMAWVVLAGCSGASRLPSFTPLPAVTVPPDPTPTPEPGPWSSGWPAQGLDHASDVKGDVEWELFAACSDGAPVPGAALYAGKVHPLVVVDMNQGWLADVGINQAFLSSGWPWSSPIQLVVCARSEEKTVGSCGAYTSEDGHVEELVRYQETMTLRVIVAATGKTLQKKVMTNPAAECPKTVSVELGSEWSIKNPVTAEQINKYAAAVLKQQVK